MISRLTRRRRPSGYGCAVRVAIFVSSGTARVRLSSGKKNSMRGIIPINVWVGLCVNVRGRLQFRECV